MTTEQIITEATKRITADTGYNYDDRALRAKVESGLEIGDKAKSGPLTIEYTGEGEIRVTQDGELRYEGAGDAQQLGGLLMLVAMRECQRGTSMGSV